MKHPLVIVASIATLAVATAGGLVTGGLYQAWQDEKKHAEQLEDVVAYIPLQLDTETPTTTTSTTTTTTTVPTRSTPTTTTAVARTTTTVPFSPTTVVVVTPADPVSDAQLAEIHAAYCAARNECRGADGTDGTNGVDGVSVTDAQVAAHVANYCAANNGCRGADGQPASREVIIEVISSLTFNCQVRDLANGRVACTFS